MPGDEEELELWLWYEVKLMALSSGIHFYQILCKLLRLNFEKRDIILIAGILLFMVGLIPFMPPIYAIAIAISIYFGIKVLVGRRKKAFQTEVGDGYCAVCGEKIIDKKCPNCEKTE